MLCVHEAPRANYAQAPPPFVLKKLLLVAPKMFCPNINQSQFLQCPQCCAWAILGKTNPALSQSARSLRLDARRAWENTCRDSAQRFQTCVCVSLRQCRAI